MIKYEFAKIQKYMPSWKVEKSVTKGTWSGMVVIFPWANQQEIMEYLFEVK